MHAHVSCGPRSREVTRLTLKLHGKCNKWSSESSEHSPATLNNASWVNSHQINNKVLLASSYIVTFIIVSQAMATLLAIHKLLII